MTFLASELLLEGFDKVGFCAEKHATYEVSGGNAWGSLYDFEAACFFYEAVAVVSVAVGGDVVAVDDVFAAVVGDVGEGGDVGRVAD
jgi:hypothetical protein